MQAEARAVVRPVPLPTFGLVGFSTWSRALIASSICVRACALGTRRDRARAVDASDAMRCDAMRCDAMRRCARPAGISRRARGATQVRSARRSRGQRRLRCTRGALQASLCGMAACVRLRPAHGRGRCLLLLGLGCMQGKAGTHAPRVSRESRGRHGDRRARVQSQWGRTRAAGARRVRSARGPAAPSARARCPSPGSVVATAAILWSRCNA